MEILTLIYKLFIGPLELFFEIIFSIAERLVGNPALAIVFLSLAMNFLVLPLYRRADIMQEEQRDKAIAMKRWNDHIRKTFSGDERFMMQQTYNRQNNYKQTDILKGSISLLLEIPFFIAAFHFLSNLRLLNGAPLGPISDLGAPDGLLTIGAANINVLPIVMTLINIISAVIYLKGFPLSSKIQTYGIAAIFLVLLYNSPAGLVFYWTLNNLFSLVKNIFYKLNSPKKVLTYLASLCGILIPIAFFAANLSISPLRISALVLLAVGMQIPLIASKVPVQALPKFTLSEATTKDNRIFHLGCIFVALLVGLLIPLSVIQSSPAEFFDTTTGTPPLHYIPETLALALGTFVIWLGVFYWIATPKGKTLFNYLLFAFSGAAIINYLFFGTDYGNLSANLVFDTNPHVDALNVILNLAILLLVGTILAMVWKRKKGIALVTYGALSVAIIATAIFSMTTINQEIEVVSKNVSLVEASQEDEVPTIPLSKNGKNVVVIMLDRAVPEFVPYLVHERPELKDALSGFTVYLNTLSYGPITNIGSPPLYGGSEYRPQQINSRANTPLVDKQNEALRVMPSIFSANNFDVTIFDPTYAGYTWIPDLTIFNDIPNTRVFRTMDGQFMEDDTADRAQLSRNFFCYSLFKIAPLALQPGIYQKGGYNSTVLTWQIRYSTSHANGPSPGFMKSYSVLDNMPEITRVNNSDHGTFLMMSNDTTHEPTILQEPAYEPTMIVNNDDYDQENAIRYTDDGQMLDFTEGSFDHLLDLTIHYQSNMAAMIKLGEWCDYLRANDVYDNTRIIIASDHSWGKLLGEDLFFKVYSDYYGEELLRDLRSFNCLLMVKDFNSTGFQFNEDFMTNADVPVIAFNDLIENPINPTSGTPIDSSYKNESLQYVMDSSEWRTSVNNGNTFIPGRWYSVHDDVRVRENWTYLYEK